MAEKKNKLLITSNRLPVIIYKNGSRWTTKSSAGGLVTAMAPILRDRGGVWLGWPGTTENLNYKKILKGAEKETGFNLQGIHFTPKEEKEFYYGFANEVIWPLFHDLQTLCNFSPSFFTTYKMINLRFAKEIIKLSSEYSFVWVHDYHLMDVGKGLKRMGFSKKVGFFLHIPFPPLDIFLKLPWRESILKSLATYDLVGFQTNRDQTNFLNCIRYLMPHIKIMSKNNKGIIHLEHKKNNVAVGVFPIGIDFAEFSDLADKPSVKKTMKLVQNWMPGRKLFLGVDRLDYTKGIPYRLQAFDYAMEKYPELQGKITLTQVLVPSRRIIPEYAALLKKIEQIVSQINGKYTRPGYIPIHYMYQSLSREKLVAYYNLSHAAVVTPLKDGMNLVAKEFCACHNDETGVLILSEFAGAARNLQKGAILVNPYDIFGMAEAFRRAYMMSEEEQKKRMRYLRKQVKSYNIFHWVENFLEAGSDLSLDNLPKMPVGQ